MTTKREAAIAALAAALAGAAEKVIRNEPRPEAVPAGGLIILSDGDPGTPDVTLSPPIYSWAHQVDLTVAAQRAPRTARTQSLDELLAAIGAAIDADPTLGGAVRWAEAVAPLIDELGVGGAAAIRTASLAVTLYYDTTGPLA